MEPMRAFLTEENILIHKEYMRTLRLRHSIMEKSIPQIKGKDILELQRSHFSQTVRDDVIPNLREYIFHQIYFESFGGTATMPLRLKKLYSSAQAFLYDVYLLASKKNEGFILIFSDDRGEVRMMHSDDVKRLRSLPKLALDVSEHAYFLDYRFDKEKYLRSALSCLNIALLDNDAKK